LIAFWVFAIVFLFRSSLLQMTDVLRETSINEKTLMAVYTKKIVPILPAFFQRETFTEKAVEQVSAYVSSLTSTILSEAFFFLIDGLLIVPLMFYMYFRRRAAIAERVFGAVPARFQASVLRAAREIGHQLHTFFAVRVIENTVVGALCCLGFFIAGVQGWLILGLVAGFMNSVPYFGPIMGAIPPLLIILLTDEPVAALYVVLTVFIAQTIDEFYLRPFVISNKVRIDPLLSIILVLAGSQLLGIMGTIFALPMYLVTKVILQEAYEELVRLYGEK
jgi:predicted PurR-regulated permease PerM